MKLEVVENADCKRIRDFLEKLATEDDWLRSYIDDPVQFLGERREKNELSQGDVRLLLEGNYQRVQAVMNKCNSAARWIVIWIV